MLEGSLYLQAWQQFEQLQFYMFRNKVWSVRLWLPPFCVDPLMKTDEFAQISGGSTWYHEFPQSGDCKFRVCHYSPLIICKGEVLCSSVELVQVIAPNLKCGRWLCYLSKIHHILKRDISGYIFIGMHWISWKSIFLH